MQFTNFGLHASVYLVPKPGRIPQLRRSNSFSIINLTFCEPSPQIRRILTIFILIFLIRLLIGIIYRHKNQLHRHFCGFEKSEMHFYPTNNVAKKFIGRVSCNGYFNPLKYYQLFDAIQALKNAVGVGQTWTWQTPTLTIVAEPTAPAGMICLFRYFNSTSGQHICTYDWEELGSTNVGYSFEKVLGYTYPSASSATNLKPIYRYYKSSDGSHFTTDLAGTYSGFVFEKILGYVGTSATASLSRSLTKYYRSSNDDHFVCIAPDVPNTTGYTQDIDFIFGYLQ